MIYQRHPDQKNLVAVNVRSEQFEGQDYLVIRAGHYFDGRGPILDRILESSTDSTMFIIRDFVETSEGSVGQVAAQFVRGFTVIGYVDASLLTQVIL